MTQALDYLTRRIIPSTIPGTSSTGSTEQAGTHHRPTATNLSDRQAVIAAMIATGSTCQDVAFELLLPVRTVQGHLDQALRILDLARAEDLTYEVIAAHHTRELTPATTRFDLPATSKTTTGGQPNALVALDAAEASQAPGTEFTEVAVLTRQLDATRAELAAARMELDRERERVRQLRQAIDSRDTIGQAKGILMERHKISADTAFRMLQDESNHSNRKLADVAHDLVYSGEEGA